MPIQNIISNSSQIVGPGIDAVKFVDQIIASAINDKATDIHIEPTENGVVVRYRVNGALKLIYEAPSEMLKSIILRIKSLAFLDVTSLPHPQEGIIRFSDKYEGSNTDVRVSIFPSYYGESIDMRLLSSIDRYQRLEDLGFLTEQAEVIEAVLQKPAGLFLVTGLASSGKSTTIFSLINRINTPEKNIVTLEDPIERTLPYVRQTQIDPKIGITMVAGLHDVLRQDPDVIMLSELSDKETIAAVLEAAASGKMIFSSMPVGSAAGTIVRLLGLGINPALIRGSLKIVTSQRLAHVNCPRCRSEYAPSGNLINQLGLEPGTRYYQALGCEACGGKGVVGQIVLHEVLPMTALIMGAIHPDATEAEIDEAAKNLGIKLLPDIIREKAREGVISVDEVARLMA